ncbi:hypothetical protein E4U12_005500 [Claviceps purpurea]|nr:hypothetical protein E4U12_005500 [Claviceps purpurea]
MSASRSMNTRSMSHNIERANPSIIENDPIQTEMQQQASSQNNPIQQDLAGNNEETETTFEHQEATLSRSIAEAEAELRIIEKRKKLEQLKAKQSLQYGHNNFRGQPSAETHFYPSRFGFFCSHSACDAGPDLCPSTPAV